MPLSPLASAYDHVLLDLDGCVYVGGAAVPGAPEAIAALRAAGRTVSFITNDARHSPEEYVRRLWSLGCQASLEEVVTVGAAIQFVLADTYGRGRTAYVIGSAAIFRHVADAGLRITNDSDVASRSEVVVIAGHDDLRFADLRPAIQAVRGGATMIAAGRDRTFPMPDGPWPGTGAVVAALEYSTERSARVVGKPEPEIFVAALDRLSPGRALMVGDRLDVDVAGAAAAGIDAAVVLSGVTGAEEANAAAAARRPGGPPAPIAVAETLHDLVMA